MVQDEWLVFITSAVKHALVTLRIKFTKQVQPSMDESRKTSRLRGTGNAPEASRVEPFTLVSDSIDLSPLRTHLGAQLGLLCAFITAVASSFWIYKCPANTLSSQAPKFIGLQVSALALIAGGVANARRFGQLWSWMTFAGLIAQNILCFSSYALALSAQSGVALLWTVGASSLLLFTHSRHLPLALLGIFNVYASSQLLGQSLPLQGAFCLFLLWTSFFSLIAVLLKCRNLAWAGLYLAPLFYSLAFWEIIARSGRPITPLLLWGLIGMQVLQILLFGVSVAGYTGSFKEPLSRGQTWLYFPALLTLFWTYSAQLARLGPGQSLIFDLVCFITLFGLFVGLAARILDAPLIDLTMVHVLAALVALSALGTVARSICGQIWGSNLGEIAALNGMLIAGAASSLALGGVCALLSTKTLIAIWQIPAFRILLTMAGMLSARGLPLMIGQDACRLLSARSFATALIAALYAGGLGLLWYKAVSSWHQITARPIKLLVLALFLVQCAYWGIVAKSGTEAALELVRR